MSLALARLPVAHDPAHVPAGLGLDVWRADQMADAAQTAVLSSGYAALDEQLPGAGWPLGAMSELLQAQPGWGEWGLLLPALVRLHQPRCVVLVGSPHLPLGPALRGRGLDPQRLLWVQADAPAARNWACEQALRCADVAAVLAWLPQVRPDALRRLHLAAHDHAKLLWVLRPAQARHESSPAPLRLLLELAPPCSTTGPQALVHILKRRGPPLDAPVSLQLQNPALQTLLAAARTRGQARRAKSAHIHVLDRIAAQV